MQERADPRALLNGERELTLTARCWSAIGNWKAATLPLIEKYASLVVDAYRRATAQNGEPGVFSADVDVLCAEFPTTEFEGEARRVSGRMLILLSPSGKTITTSKLPPVRERIGDH